jgi:hypothetical protein
LSIGDWTNSAINLVIGVLLGWSAHGLIGLTTSAFWPLAILIPALFLGVLLLDWYVDAISERLFPTGVKPATTPNRKPLARRLSLPSGLAIGLIAAWLGLGLPFLGTI